MYRTLRDFVEALEAEGELKRIRVPVDSSLEIAEIAHRMARLPAPSRGLTGPRVDPDRAGLGGFALLFENIRDVESDIPVAINLFGSYRRMEMALGCGVGNRRWGDGGLEAIAGEIARLTKPEPPAGWRDLIAKARQFLPVLKSPPRTARGPGLCQEVIKQGGDVNLFELPILKCWPLDGDPASVGFPPPPDQIDTKPGGGRFVTLAGMYTVHARDLGKAKAPSRNIGMYRAQLIDRTRLAMHWHVHHDGASHWRSFKRAGHERMPIAIVLGGESVLPYAATAPLPPGISELLMAGFLNGGPIRLVPCRTIPMHVPANAEIVIEGWVSTQAGVVGYDPRKDVDDEGRPLPLGPGAVLEGPFGDHTGFYSLPDRYPIVEVTAITHRRNPIYPATIVGLPPQEDYYLGKATERLFLPLLRTLIHDVDDYDLPLFGCFHNCAIIRIHKEYPLQARRVMHAVWGAGQMAWTKMIIVVDDDVNVHRLPEVLAAVFRHAHFGRDLELANGPLDILDHAAPSLGAGCKIGIDATRKSRGEEVGGIEVDEGSLLPDEWTEEQAEITQALLREAVTAAGVEVLGVALPGLAKGRLALMQIRKPDGASAIGLPAGRATVAAVADLVQRTATSPATAGTKGAVEDDDGWGSTRRRGGFGGLAETLAPDHAGHAVGRESVVGVSAAAVAMPQAAPRQDRVAGNAANGEARAVQLPDFLIVVDQVCDFGSLESVLFHLTANADPGRDLMRTGRFIGFDATHKTANDVHREPGDLRRHDVRDFPPILKMDEAIRERVTRRWEEYGFGGLSAEVPDIPSAVNI